MRIRLRFNKTGKVRWTSHRDVARIWERAIRRTGMPIAYSQGFSPHPRLHFGLALSTGHESDGEFLDIDLDDRSPALPSAADLDVLPARLSAVLPAGMDVTAAAQIASNATSLQQAVQSCEWLVEIRGVHPAGAAAGIDAALAAPQLIVTRQRKGKDVTDDVRPYLLHLAVLGPTDGGTLIEAHLATQPRGLRIGELIALLAEGAEEGRVRRSTQWTLLDGARSEPLAGPSEATSAPHADRRAS